MEVGLDSLEGNSVGTYFSLEDPTFLVLRDGDQGTWSLDGPLVPASLQVSPFSVTAELFFTNFTSFVNMREQFQH